MAWMQDLEERRSQVWMPMASRRSYRRGVSDAGQAQGGWEALGVAGANMYLFYFRNKRPSARKLEAREGNVGGS